MSLWNTNDPPPVSLYGATNGYDYVQMDNDGVVQWGVQAGKISANSLDIGSIISAVKKSLGHIDNPLVKCRHCGQWAAVFTACAHCGAPVDPKE